MTDRVPRRNSARNGFAVMRLRAHENAVESGDGLLPLHRPARGRPSRSD